MHGNILSFFHGKDKSVTCDADRVGRNQDAATKEGHEVMAIKAFGNIIFTLARISAVTIGLMVVDGMFQQMFVDWHFATGRAFATFPQYCYNIPILGCYPVWVAWEIMFAVLLVPYLCAEALQMYYHHEAERLRGSTPPPAVPSKESA
jgi:hypothetical protein